MPAEPCAEQLALGRTLLIPGRYRVIFAPDDGVGARTHGSSVAGRLDEQLERHAQHRHAYTQVLVGSPAC